MNNLIITKGEVLHLDNVELKKVINYELRHSAGNSAELTIKMEVTVHQADSE